MTLKEAKKIIEGMGMKVIPSVVKDYIDENLSDVRFDYKRGTITDNYVSLESDEGLYYDFIKGYDTLYKRAVKELADRLESGIDTDDDPAENSLVRLWIESGRDWEQMAKNEIEADGLGAISSYDGNVDELDDEWYFYIE